jgi:hypothetical protein
VAHGIIEKNHFIRDKSNILIYLDFADKVLVRYNKFENGGIAIYNHSSNLQVYYNEFINITNILFAGGGPKGSDTRYLNNTFYNVNIMIQSWTENVTFQNNIVYHCYGKMFDGSTNIVPDYNCYYKSVTTSNIGTNSIQVDPQFNDTTKLDFCLKNTSPCLDKGNNVWSSYKDISGITVPIGSSVDIGSHECSSGATLNKSPIISITTPSTDQSYTALASINISANATDADGTISKVEFFDGSTKLGESTTSPYSFIWSNVAAGTYSLTAVAIDNLNAQTTSTFVTVYVNNEVAATNAPSSANGSAEVLNVYPNPTDGHFSVGTINSSPDEKVKIIVSNMSGKTVYTENLYGNETIKDFDLTDIKAGTYIITVVYNKNRYVSRKLVKF